MSLHSNRGHRCAFETLENRWMLTGNVTAQIANGDLVIEGDDSGNVIAVSSPTTGSITITGTGTMVNSSPNPVTLTGFTGRIKANMNGGGDNLAFTGITCTGLRVVMGDGEETLHLDSLTVNGKTKLKGGTGEDFIKIGLIAANTFNGNLEIELGKSNDSLEFQDSKVTGKSEIETGKGADTLTITGTTSGAASFSKLEAELGKGDDSLTIKNTTVTDKTRLNGGRGHNTFVDDGGNSLAGLKKKHFES